LPKVKVMCGQWIGDRQSLTHRVGCDEWVGDGIGVEVIE
jgi:hypothetical protein